MDAACVSFLTSFLQVLRILLSSYRIDLLPRRFHVLIRELLEIGFKLRQDARGGRWAVNGKR